MAINPVDVYASELERIFRSTEDCYRSHEMSRKVLTEMAQDPAFLRHLIRKHLSHPQNYNRPNFPLPGMTIAETPYHTCYAHFWFGNMPQRERGQSVTCVHHHGALLLTTIAIHGPGCEVWMFSRPRETAVDGIFTMEHLIRHQNSFGSFTFVDARQPHLIFPPESFSVTIALWSRGKQHPFINALKYNPLVRRNKQWLLKTSRVLRLTETLQINEVINFDFIPLEEGFKAFPERLQYPYTPNEDYLANLFHIVKETGNENQAPVVLDVIKKAENALHNPPLIKALVGRLEGGDPMRAKVAASHCFIPGLNVTKGEVLRALGLDDAEVPIERETGR